MISHAYPNSRAPGVQLANTRTLDAVGKLPADDITREIAGTMRHVVNHSTYHRGQITNFLRHLGAEPVATDLVVYYMENPPA